jgi:hypothetical protein
MFYFSENHLELDKPWVNGSKNMYSHNFPYGHDWTPPPLKEYYGNVNILQYEKPTLTINNKFNPEWSRPRAYNRFDLGELTQIFDRFSDKYQILYIRAVGDEKGYSDSVTSMEFNDYELIADKYPDVITIKDIMVEHPEYSYNEIQFMMEATSEKHLTVSGGNAIISAYFGGDCYIYTCVDSPNATRGQWMTDSWLNRLSDANIFGYLNFDKLIEGATKR